MISFRPVLRVVGPLLCGLAVIMLVPAAVDAARSNPDWRAFLGSAVVTGFVGGMISAASWRDRSSVLGLRQAFLLTVSCWMAVAGFGALPFLALGHGYTDAFFEAISGVTTTGSTVISGLDELPPGLLLWRSLLQWFGGVGIVVMAIVMLPFLRIGGMQLFHTESSDRSGGVVPGAFVLAAWITGIYGLLTVACALTYAAMGMSVFDAINHAMTTLSTGGYSTHDESFRYFAKPGIDWTGTLFMLSGALPFVAYIRLVKGDRRALWKDPQVRGLITFLLLAVGAMAAWLSISAHIGLAEALRLSAFNIVSIVTTTGYVNDDYGSWGPLAVGAFFMFTFIGGCTGSTAGAIKVFRFQIMWILVRTHLLRLVSPRRVIAPTYGERKMPPDVPASVLAFITVYLATVAVFTVALAGMGLDLVTALSASATAISNVGPGLGSVVGPTDDFATLSDAAKWILSAAMLLGRLEIFTVLVLLDPRFWRP